MLSGVLNGHSSGRTLIYSLVLVLIFSLLFSFVFTAYAQTGPMEAYFIDWDNAEIQPGHHTVYGPSRMVVDKNNKIWFGVGGKNIGEFDSVTGTITRHACDCCGGDDWDTSVIGVDKHGTGWVWFGPSAWRGDLVKYDPATGSFTCIGINLPSGIRVGLGDLVVDNAGYVWMTAVNWWLGYYGIIKYDYRTGQFTEYHPDWLAQFNDLYIDREGTIWFNDGFTSIGRLDRTTGKFTRYNVGYASRGLTQDDLGNFWFGYGNSVAKLKPSTKEVSTFNMPEGTQPRAFFKNDKGDIFFAGKNKMIHRLTPGTNSIIDYEMVVGWLGNDIEMDSAGNLWFTEGNSVVKLPRDLARGATTSQAVPVNYKKTINNAQGGKIATDFSDAINFQAGSLTVASAELTVTMEEAPSPQLAGQQPIPRAFRFAPTGQTFEPDALNKVSYSVGVDLQTIDPANVGVYYWDSGTSSWVYQNSSNDVENKTLQFPVDHFSDYALFAPKVRFAWEDPLTEAYNYPLSNGDALPINFKLEREDGELISQGHLKVKVTMPMDPHDPWFPERITIKEFTIDDGLVYDEGVGVYRAQLNTSLLTHEDGTAWPLPKGEFYKAEVFYAGLKKSEAEFSLLDPATKAIVYTVASASPKANEKGWHHQDVKVNLKAYYLTLDPEDEGGIEEIYYQLDGNTGQGEGSEVEVPITQEGERTLKYWAVDTQGREEEAKTLKIKLDKTPPEAVIYFDPDYKAFKIEVKADNYSGEEMVRPSGVEMLKPQETPSKGKSCSSRQIINYTLSDAADNSLEIPIFIGTTKEGLRASLEKLIYNQEERPIEENNFQFKWVLDKAGGFNQLHQNLDVKGKFHLIATYDSKNNETEVRVLGPGEKTQKEVTSGVKIIKIEIKNGQLEYLP